MDIKKLNDMKIIQEDIDWAENLPKDVWDEINGKYKEVAEGIDVDKRRWYETSISVIEIDGVFIGIQHITNLFSESNSCDDICYELQFFEMEKIQITSFKIKEQ